MFMLTRQWQLGEFMGEDAGSPVQATIETEAVPLKRFHAAESPAVNLDGRLPLDVCVEAESIALGVRGAVQLGLRFEAAMSALAPALSSSEILELEDLIDKFRTKYPVELQSPAGELPDARSRQFRAAAGGRVTDGCKLYEAAKGSPQNVPLDPIIPSSLSASVATVLQAFVAFRKSLYSEPVSDKAWKPEELRYGFSVDVNAMSLEAKGFPGGRMDWESFSLVAPKYPTSATTPPSKNQRTFIPQNLTFRGMPSSRWWNFEAGETDFGQLDTELVDLAKMIVMEFALVYGNDWFELPVPMEVGTLSRVTRLVVTNTFGERTLIRPTEDLAKANDRPWSMFKLSRPGLPAPPDFIFVPPAVAVTQDGADLEEVSFLRDEMAAMAWAIERKVPGPMDTGLDAYEPFLQRMADLQRSAPPPAPKQTGDPDIRYVLGNSVPDNWLPMVPVKTTERDFIYRRGLMEITASGLTGAHAHGVVLEPDQAFYVYDEAIPRAGVSVRRYFRRARWTDGSTRVWLARQVRPGPRAGVSGLAFDIIQEVTAPAAP
jgi:hypothetical protein